MGTYLFVFAVAVSFIVPFNLLNEEVHNAENKTIIIQASALISGSVAIILGAVALIANFPYFAAIVLGGGTFIFTTTHAETCHEIAVEAVRRLKNNEKKQIGRRE